MGTYVGVRGWVEFAPEQHAAVLRVLEAADHDLYSAGWAVPTPAWVVREGVVREGAAPERLRGFAR
ncbi:hypothetical protein [Lentzea sp. NPDC003310]|uniref:hypothetical protein n=1 Tax=Lentzea sp. NPDC003310 TaxID=3154447 RepID=UPI0033A8606D